MPDASPPAPAAAGVEAPERLRSDWTTATNASGAAAPQRLPAHDPVALAPTSSPKRKPCIRASVWLYDPTEDQPLSPEHDVKLRPISRALFEIRGAGQEKMKSIAKFKEREVSKLMQRSRYYGPTESSRHMRWQEEQRRMKQSQSPSSFAVSVHHSRPRSASHSAISNRNTSCTRRREHEKLDGKSFIQSTELLRQRKLELMARKALIAANASSLGRSQASSSQTHGTRSLANPQAARDAVQKQKRTKKFASTALSSVPEEDRCAADDVSPSRSPTHHLAIDDSMSSFSTLRCADLSLIDASAPLEFAMELLSPGADQDVALPTPPPIVHLQSPIPPVTSPSHSQRRRCATIDVAPSSLSCSSFEFEDDRMSGDDGFATRSVELTAVQVQFEELSERVSSRILGDEQNPAEETQSTEANSTSAPALARVSSDELDSNADIDDMLDYFDGVTLPI